ncbi:MAG: hypothetical protein KJP10_02420 [Gammaproteobacteria bacterium]|nr:hypothetical protein [Gammaproteobacteria bacterium]
MLPVASTLVVLLSIGNADLCQHREFIAGHISNMNGRHSMQAPVRKMKKLKVVILMIWICSWTID